MFFFKGAVKAFSSPFHSLELLSLVAERAAHSLSTPAALLAGVIEDSGESGENSDAQLLDIRRAAADIGEVLQTMKGLAVPASFAPEGIDLSGLLLEEFRSIPFVRLQQPKERFVCSIDRRLILRSIAMLLAYLHKLAALAGAGDSAACSIELQRDTQYAAVSLQLGPLPRQFCRGFPASQRLEDLARGQHLFEVVCPLFAALIAELHGGFGCFERQSAQRLAVTLHLPLKQAVLRANSG